jgi:PTS system N-acetylglucosamine-specific IIC component
MDIRAALDRPLAVPTEAAPAAASNKTLPEAIVRALGGEKNIRSATHHHGRWRIELVDENLVTDKSDGAPIRQIAKVSPNLVHVLVS